MPVAVEFSNPWWLLALPALVACLIAARLPWWRAARRAGRRALRLEARRLALRLAWMCLLLLALTGISLTRPLFHQATVLVVDASASLASARDQIESAVREAEARLPDDDLAGVVAVADGALVEEMPAQRPVFSRLEAVLPDGASDLATGLRLAAAILPSDYAGRVVLVSDGRQTAGDAIAAARELAARGLTVDVLPTGVAQADDLRIEAIDLPETAYQGEESTLTARLYATRATSASLHVYRDDGLLLERTVQLRPGWQEIALPVAVGSPGLHRYRVALTATDPAADSTAANNALGAIQRVVGPPQVLLVAADPAAAGLLPGALRAGGTEVTITGPAGVPADLAGWTRYDAVFLVDLRADALPPGAMEQLESYVHDLGRGLVMTGGADSFGPGGYADTPVERALPVYMDLRGRGRQPRVALALVIDKSGSMSGVKVEMAKEAAARSIRLLRPTDQAAVVAFDSVPQWVALLTPLTERERLEQAIGSIYASGGTEIYPALAAGFSAVRDAEADVKHIILLTDGRSGSSGEYAALLEQMREARVSLSTVAVGSDADTALLQAMARLGRGRYQFADDPTSIPEIFTQETIMATRTILVNNRFYPAAASSSPLLRGLASVPPLDGYVAVTAKERAEVVLVSPEADPVLSAWQYGAGRSVAWAPDLTNRWSGAWASSFAATVLWGNVLSWLLPSEDSPGELAVRVEATGGEGEGGFAILAENRSGWDQVRPSRAEVVGPDGKKQELELAPAGPGRYRAHLGNLEPGAYVVQVSQSTEGGGEVRGETGWVAPYPAEYREVGVDHALLAQVAAAGGGRVLDDPAQAVRPADHPAIARWPLWQLLLTLAALCWPVEIASRRLLPSGTVARLPLSTLQLRRVGTPVSQRSANARQGEASAPSPAAATAHRLLERKRAFRAGRSAGAEGSRVERRSR